MLKILIQEFKILSSSLKNITRSIFILCVFFNSSFAQGEFQEDTRIFYRDELSFSVGVRSNGIGLGTRYAKRKTALNKNLYEFQATSLRHPKEIRLFSEFGGRQIYGKLNSTYQFLFSYGRQNEKFSKLDKGSVAIRFIYQVGIALALEKPYYYIVEDDDKAVYEKFYDSNKTKLAKAPFFVGFSETKVVPGLHLAYTVNFEFKKQEKYFRALEFGASAQVFPRKIKIMHTKENSWVFPTLFINYRFGKILGDF